MKKVSTAAVKATKNCSQPKLTIGLDLGDRSSWYCVLDEVGEVLLEQKLGTTPKAMREVFGAMPRCRIALETGTHSPWVIRRYGWRSPDRRLSHWEAWTRPPRMLRGRFGRSRPCLRLVIRQCRLGVGGIYVRWSRSGHDYSQYVCRCREH